MTRSPTRSEQNLVDIAIQLAIASRLYMKGKDTKEVAEWAADQLSQCGYKNVPCGASWAYVTEVSASVDKR